MSTELPDAIRRYFDLMNAEEWDRFGDVWTPDATVVAVGAPPRHGRDEILDHYRRLFRAWDHHLDSPTRVLPCGQAVTVEVHFEGTTADGRTLGFDAVDIFDLADDGRIARLTNWYDLVMVRRLLAGDSD